MPTFSTRQTQCNWYSYSTENVYPAFFMTIDQMYSTVLFSMSALFQPVLTVFWWNFAIDWGSKWKNGKRLEMLSLCFLSSSAFCYFATILHNYVVNLKFSNLFYELPRLRNIILYYLFIYIYLIFFTVWGGWNSIFSYNIMEVQLCVLSTVVYVIPSLLMISLIKLLPPPLMPKALVISRFGNEMQLKSS